MNEQALNISTGRKYWIDVLRALGIILVVLGHVSKEPNTVIFIYAFHMPLFFLLSGFLFNRHRYDLRTFIIRRSQKLLLPYAFFYLLTLLWWWLVECNFSPPCLLWDHLVATSDTANVGIEYKRLVSHNIVLWFLPALFSTEVLARLLADYICCRKTIFVVSVLCAVLGLGLYTKGIEWLPMGLNVALVALPFYVTGWMVAERVQYWTHVRHVILVAVGCCLLLLIAVHEGWATRIDMASGQYGCFLLFLLWSGVGCMMMIAIAIALGRVSWIEHIGYSTSTLVIMAIHGIILRIVIFTISRMTNVGTGDLRENLWICILITMIVIGVCLPFVGLYKRCVNKLICRCIKN